MASHVVLMMMCKTYVVPLMNLGDLPCVLFAAAPRLVCVKHAFPLTRMLANQQQ